MRNNHKSKGHELKMKNGHSCELSALLPEFLQQCVSALGLCLVALALTACRKKEAPREIRPPEVQVTEVVQRDVPVYAEFIAQLNGPVNAEITPKVQGYLLKQNYQNGFFVRKGQLLFMLDPRQYQAALDGAKAQLGVAEANLGKVDADVQRDTPLAAEKAIAQRDLDTDLSNQQAMRSQVQAAKADLANAHLNLAWTNVYSPIDGIAGDPNSQIGDLVGTSTKMAIVSQVNPIWAYFNPSESLFLKFAPEVTRYITGKDSPASHKRMPVEFIQADDVPYPKTGTIISVNRQVGTQTGTIQMAAAFPNPQALLRPGGYGRVRIQVDNNKNALMVPQAAVIEVQSEYMLIVLNPESRAVFRPVKVGDRVGPNWVITEGLKPGERVVVEGTERVQMFAAQAPQLVKEGIPVTPRPYVSTSTASGGN
jgi:membrane fusion protein (multidrug efflux system)